MENLRYLLLSYNKSEPLYVGCRFKPFSNQGFMSGGAGYLLTSSSVDLFVRSVEPQNVQNSSRSKII